MRGSPTIPRKELNSFEKDLYAEFCAFMKKTVQYQARLLDPDVHKAKDEDLSKIPVNQMSPEQLNRYVDQERLS